MGRGLGWGSGPPKGCGPVTQHSAGGREEGGGFTSRATGNPTPTPAVPQVLMCPPELAAKRNQEQTASTFTRPGRRGPLLRKCPQLPGWPSGHLAAHLSHVGPWADALPTRLPGKSRWRSPPRWVSQGGALWGPPLGCPCLAPLHGSSAGHTVAGPLGAQLAGPRRGFHEPWQPAGPEGKGSAWKPAALALQAPPPALSRVPAASLGGCLVAQLPCSPQWPACLGTASTGQHPLDCAVPAQVTSLVGCLVSEALSGRTSALLASSFLPEAHWPLPTEPRPPAGTWHHQLLPPPSAP